MPFDPNTLPSAVKAALIKLGEQFGSTDTLDQANQTLGALAKRPSLLVTFGFSTGDETRLEDTRDLLIAAGVGRTGAVGEKKTASAGYAKALANAQTARIAARAVADGTKAELEESGDDTTAARLGTALRQTAAAPDDPEKLCIQLDTLAGVLEAPAVAPTAKGRGGAEAVQQLRDTAKALRAADQATSGVGGTPVATEALDLLDGLVVRLTRRARKSALAAAKATGSKAVAKEFRLDKLYQSRGKGTPQGPRPAKAAKGSAKKAAAGNGATGASGASGATGATGASGATGATGAGGPVAGSGATGATAATGAAGATGPTGPAAGSGATGATGATAATGMTGP
jgi:hypothetical protein